MTLADKAYAIAAERLPGLVRLDGWLSVRRGSAEVNINERPLLATTTDPEMAAEILVAAVEAAEARQEPHGA